jgi:hypothetical protein
MKKNQYILNNLLLQNMAIRAVELTRQHVLTSRAMDRLERG